MSTSEIAMNLGYDLNNTFRLFFRARNIFVIIGLITAI